MAYQALYRKYRPKNFDQVVGQDSINRIFKNQIKYNRIGHAYILSGIRGTGKTSLAKIFARAINCENPLDGNPCNRCNACLKIDTSGIMDIIEIDGASNRGVDEIREIREKVKYPPVIGRFKVYIIDEVHMLTKEAFNALLKTLEEPPAHVVFILATTEPQKCPATILSRCQRYEVKPISKALIVAQLRRIADDFQLLITDESLEFIAGKGDHSMRDALSIMDQIIDLKNEKGQIDYGEILSFLGVASRQTIALIIEGILQERPADVILQLRELQNAGKESQLILDQMIDYLRNVLIIKSLSGADQGILNLSSEDLKTYQEVADKASLSRFYQMIDYFIGEKNKLKYSNLQNIILEMACLKLAYSDEDRNTKKGDVARELTGGSKTEAKSEARGAAKVEINVATKVQTKVEPKIEDKAEAEVQAKVQAKKVSQQKSGREELSGQANVAAAKNDTGDVLFQKLCDTIGSAQCMFLKKGSAVFTGDELIINFSQDHQNFYDFINRPEHIVNFEEICKAETGQTIKVTLRLLKEDFNKLDLVEKTKRIINDEKVKITKD